LKSATSTATQNVAAGSGAGSNNTTGGQNVLLGYNAAPTLTTGNSNIVIGSGADVPSASTSNYLNIGGAITGSMAAGGHLSLANSPSAGDNTTKIATTAFVTNAVGAATGAMFKLGTGTVDTSSTSTSIADFRTAVGSTAYTKLVLEITKLVNVGPAGNASILLVEFANQGTANSGNNYGTGTGVSGGPSQILDNSSNSNYVCGNSGIYATDGSVTIEMRGFCNTTTSVMPNITTKGMLYQQSGAASTSYFDTSILNIGCNNLANAVFDGLYFLVTGGSNSFTFSWALYGIV
jgi:hypothetical protein